MITNKVKSYQKINETVQTANFSDFPLIFCRNGLCERKQRFSIEKTFLRYVGYHIMKAL